MINLNAKYITRRFLDIFIAFKRFLLQNFISERVNIFFYGITRTKRYPDAFRFVYVHNDLVLHVSDFCRVVVKIDHEREIFQLHYFIS